MLELKKICKTYITGSFKQEALKDVSLKFRKNEFVSVLGASGSGKTTLLNIIGGLDRYDSGDLIINNKSTKNFKAIDWDRYRNNCVGFIFQSYNLISHISILDNVEMGMTLSGVSAKVRRKKAKEALKKVGLADHMHKKPNQLSGGQMQRVAIARALANDPDVILADEPTGALDTKTSVQIMELIKEIAKDKLVIMVTHNPELAKTYANRIIEFKDGEKVSDSNPVKEDENEDKEIIIRKTAMSFLTALKLSFNNIKTKKGRTILTAFASSIGIIGIALILSLSNGFKIQIDEFEKKSLSQAPIYITTQAMNMDATTMQSLENKDLKEYPTVKKVFSQKDVTKVILHKNNITKKYIEYLNKMDPKLMSGISYSNGTTVIAISKDKDGNYNLIDSSGWALLPTNPNHDNDGVIDNMFDVIAGKIDDSEPGLILQVDSKNQLFESALEALGITDKKEVNFKDLIGREVKIVFNDDFYLSDGDAFRMNTDFESLYNSDNAVSIKVQAIIRGKEDYKMMTNSSGICYTQSLVDIVIAKNKDSKIVKAQQDADYNVINNSTFSDFVTKESVLGALGDDVTPSTISIYPKDFKSKEKITEYLDKYNDKIKKDEDKINYTDMASMISSLSGNIMDAITIVLIAFSSISLVVSSIMIGIITYISVLERTKEIGILRSLGARARDIKRVFIAETFIIGISSGILGILIARLLIFPINIIIKSMTDLANVARMNIVHVVGLLFISTILTIIGGYIPARIASKKDPVESLRSE